MAAKGLNSCTER